MPRIDPEVLQALIKPSWNAEFLRGALAASLDRQARDDEDKAATEDAETIIEVSEQHPPLDEE